jgi:transposase
VLPWCAADHCRWRVFALFTTPAPIVIIVAIVSRAGLWHRVPHVGTIYGVVALALMTKRHAK